MSKCTSSSGCVVFRSPFFLKRSLVILENTQLSQKQSCASILSQSGSLSIKPSLLISSRVDLLTPISLLCIRSIRLVFALLTAAHAIPIALIAPILNSSSSALRFF